MVHPVHEAALHVAKARGWKVANGGEALVAIQLGALGYTPADVATQFNLGQFKLDFALVPERVAIEADGWVHTARDVRKRDALRNRQLREWGWTVVRIDVDGDIGEQLRRKVPDRSRMPGFDETLRRTWALFGLATDRLARRGIDDPVERIRRLREILHTAIEDPSLYPARRSE